MARILIVDDATEILDLCRVYLSSAGHDVMTTSNGFDALEYLIKFEFDYLYVDLNMPHINGFQLLERLKQGERYKNLVIIILTSSKSSQDVKKAIQYGAKQYLIKPIEKAKLLESVEKTPKKSESADKEFFLKELKLNNDLIACFNWEIYSVSDNGFKIRIDHPLTVGSKMNLQSPFFIRLGLQSELVLTVKNCQEIEGNLYEVKFWFDQLEGGELELIKAWIKKTETALQVQKKSETSNV